MARGRRPGPAQSKVIQGNFRPDRHAHGPRVDTGLPPCPKWLDRQAKKHWSAIGGQLAAAGLISVIDGDVFAAHCDTVARFAEVCSKLKDVEQALDDTPNGFMVQSALFTVRSKLFDQLLKSAREFGLTPAARSAIKSPEQSQLPLDGWADV